MRKLLLVFLLFAAVKTFGQGQTYFNSAPPSSNSFTPTYRFITGDSVTVKAYQGIGPNFFNQIPTYAQMRAAIAAAGTGLPSQTGNAGKFLTTNGTVASWATISSSITSLSIATANGFAGSSSGGSTPILTLQTSITGLLKGNGTAISAATAGTDYLTPTGNASGLTGLLWSQIGSTPTTLGGYGITDAYTKTASDARFAPIFSGTGYSKFASGTLSYVTAIPNADLANSAITIQGTSTALGGSVNPINGTGFVKSSGTTISYDNSTYLTTSSAASTYQPLEDQRLSTTNSPSFVKQSITGTAGTGYLDLISQSASPASLSGHLRLYSDSLNRLSWKNSNYRRTIQVPYPSDYTIRMPYLVTGTTLEDSTHASTTYLAKNAVSGSCTSCNLTYVNGQITVAANGSGGFTNPMTTTGDIIYSSSGSTPARLGIGGANTLLHGGTIPSYSSVVNGDIANGTIDLTAKVTGLLPDANISSASTWNGKFTLPSLINHSVLFSNGTTITQDNNNFYYDATAHALHVGVNADFNGTNTINIYGQMDAYEPQSAIGAVTDGTAYPGITASSSRGTGASPSINNTLDNLGGFSGWMYTGSSPAYTYAGGMSFSAVGATSSNLGGQIDFYTKVDGASTTSSRMRIMNDGTIGFAQVAPVSLAPTATPGSAGTLAAGTYYAKIVALDAKGIPTTASPEVSATTSGSTGSIVYNWTAGLSTYASRYRIYIGTSPGGENIYYTTTNGGDATTTFTYTGAASTAGSPVTVNNTSIGFLNNDGTIQTNGTGISVATARYNSVYKSGVWMGNNALSGIVLGNDATNYIIAGSNDAGGSLQIWTNNSAAFGSAPNGNDALDFSAAGNATFNKNLTIAGTTTFNGPIVTNVNVTFGTASGGAFLQSTNAGSNSVYETVNNTGGQLLMGLVSSTGTGTPGSAYDASIGNTMAHNLVLFTNNVEKMRIYSSGGVYVGATPSDPGANNFQVQGTVILKGYTVATLPTGTTGMTAYVTDALTPSFGTTLVGGGAIVTKAFYNGTNWIAE